MRPSGGKNEDDALELASWKSSGVKRFDRKYFRLSRHDFKMQIGNIGVYKVVKNILSSRKH